LFNGVVARHHANVRDKPKNYGANKGFFTRRKADKAL
jgi:hypothetical protein